MLLFTVAKLTRHLCSSALFKKSYFRISSSEFEFLFLKKQCPKYNNMKCSNCQSLTPLSQDSCIVPFGLLPPLVQELPPICTNDSCRSKQGPGWGLDVCTPASQSPLCTHSQVTTLMTPVSFQATVLFMYSIATSHWTFHQLICIACCVPQQLV